MNDESRETYNVDDQIIFKSSMLMSSLCDYSDPYILVKKPITIENKADQDQPNNGANKKVIRKNCVPFTKCISRINNAPMYCQ